ncbi:MAG TPA: hemolysin family protein [Bacteroidales bacterium]|nr:hemolysin family protein [Bacteroidales bacterium]HXK91228.1 hemolysin family protein [Bacteroidales bacterium]
MFAFILTIILTLVISFLCSIMEASILSVTPSYSAYLLANKPVQGEKLEKLKKSIDRTITGILTLNTIANTFGSILIGMLAANIFGSGAAGIIGFIMTFLILYFSEILPKTIGTYYWRKHLNWIIPVLIFLRKITYPFYLLSQGMMKLVVPKNEVSHTVEEIRALAILGYQKGILDNLQTQVIDNTLKLKELPVHDIMTPRTVAAVVDENMTVKELINLENFFKYSRIPVYSGNIDNITGYVFKNDVLNALIHKNENTKLSEIKRKIVIVYEFFNIKKAMDEMIKKNEQIAVVVDEYSSFVGIITIEDIVETLLGIEIIDEADQYQDLQAYAKKLWQMKINKFGIFKPEDLDSKKDE